MHLGYGNRGQVRHKVQLSGDETQWVLQQLQGLGEKKKIAQRIWAWPLDIPDQTVATSALTDLAVAVRPDASRNSSRIAAWTPLQADLVVQAVLGAAVLTEALGNEVVARSDEAHATRCLALGDLQTAKLKADAEHRRRSAQNRLPVDASH